MLAFRSMLRAVGCAALVTLTVVQVAGAAPPNPSDQSVLARYERIGIPPEILAAIGQAVLGPSGSSPATVQARAVHLMEFLRSHRADLRAHPLLVLRATLRELEGPESGRIQKEWTLTEAEERCAVDFALCLYGCLGLIYPPAEAACAALCTALYLDCLKLL